MKTFIPALIVGLAISFGATTFVSAETATTPAPTTTTPAPAPTTTKAPKAPEKPRSAKSIECSKQADAQGLHGKKRKTFRKECMKGST